MRTKTYFSAMLGFCHFSSSEHAAYRFGFNGMEKDDEVSGNGNSYGTTFRQYDSRIGRWFSIDPKAGDFASRSPYSSFASNPVRIVDPRGDTDYIMNAEGKLIAVNLSDAGDRYFQVAGQGDVITHSAMIGENAVGLTLLDNPTHNYVMVMVEVEGSIGHSAVGADGKLFNFYPTDLNNSGAYEMSDLKSSPLDAHTNSVTESEGGYPKSNLFFLEVTPEQKEALMTEGESRMNPPKGTNYKLFTNNCTTNVCDILESSGIMSSEETDGLYRPGVLNDYMKNDADNVAGSMIRQSPFGIQVAPDSEIGQKKSEDGGSP